MMHSDKQMNGQHINPEEQPTTDLLQAALNLSKLHQAILFELGKRTFEEFKQAGEVEPIIKVPPMPSKEESNQVELKTKRKPMKPRQCVNSTCGFKGVNRRTDSENRSKQYSARIGYNGKVYFLGDFKTAKQAAKAYDKKALEFFGDEAFLNFPELKGK